MFAKCDAKVLKRQIIDRKLTLINSELSFLASEPWLSIKPFAHLHFSCATDDNLW